MLIKAVFAFLVECLTDIMFFMPSFADPKVVYVFLRDSRLQSRLTPIRPSPLETRRLYHIDRWLGHWGNRKNHH